MATLAPSRANSTAVARPMPLSPPVTMATLPFEPSRAGIARLPLGLGIELRLVAGELRLLGDLLDVGFVDGLGVISW
jgi:hypothetical protein